ncbi:hypothetical protein BW897_11010 [Bacillus cereus]|uniref:Uncharacterized protein n=1 Tax=Bacillus cereus TaxID=1396 RepID=A0A1S9TRG4_BACCE|nr:hypothetical protein [Bacillus cereus]OOR12634.1 hypothetical protein BW897_11010 [Bacillus cereus]
MTLFDKQDFVVANISNIPSDKAKLLNLLKLFNNKSYTWNEILNEEFHNIMELSSETFRKMVNHSTMIGILNFQDRKYSLTENSKKLLNKEIDIDKYFITILKSETAINKTSNILLLLLTLFSGTLRLKTIYTIFSYVGKERLDDSSLAAVGRNLRAIFSILKIIGIIEKSGNEILLKDKFHDNFGINNIKPIDMYFNSRIIDAKNIRRYLNEFFDQQVTTKILTCVSTYETTRYIWSKSSLYKNQGEIQNLYDEYIMTVIIKGGGQ